MSDGSDRKAGFRPWMAAGVFLLVYLPLFYHQMLDVLRDFREPKHGQLLLLLATASVSGWIAWLLTRRRALAFLSFAAVGLDRALVALSAGSLPENLAVFLLTALSLLLVLAVTKGRLVYFAASGIVLGVLATTGPWYAYLWLPVAAILRGLPAIGSTTPPSETSLLDRRLFRVGTAAYLVAFLVPVGSWMARNAWRHGRFFLNVEEGVALDARATLDGMTRTEAAASVLHWSGSWYLKTKLLPRTFGEEATALLDDSKPESAAQRAAARRADLVKVHGGIVADRVQTKEAAWMVLRHPLRHVLATFPIALRGIYVNGMVLGVLMFAALLGALALARSSRDVATLAALAPAALTFAIHAALTPNPPHLNRALIPLLWVGVLYVLRRLGQTDALVRRASPFRTYSRIRLAMGRRDPASGAGAT